MSASANYMIGRVSAVSGCSWRHAADRERDIVCESMKRGLNYWDGLTRGRRLPLVFLSSARVAKGLHTAYCRDGPEHVELLALAT